jgi:hypothetical protein
LGFLYTDSVALRGVGYLRYEDYVFKVCFHFKLDILREFSFVPFCYFLKDSPAFVEPVKAVEILRALRNEEDPYKTHDVEENSYELKPEPVAGYVLEVETYKTDCEVVEDE